MKNSNLHNQIDFLLPQGMRRILVHALIDLNIVTELRCLDSECRYPGKAFTKFKDCRVTSLTLDHIIRKQHGGSDYPENIRLLHFGCNSGFERKGTSAQASHVRYLNTTIRNCRFCDFEGSPGNVGRHEKTRHKEVGAIHNLT